MSFEVNCKRFYIPKFDWACPTCGTIKTFDYYVSYPCLDEPNIIYGYCSHDDTEYEDCEDFEEQVATVTIRADIQIDEEYQVC